MLSIMDYIARFYDPAIGRFIQPDTIVPNPANPQSWNRYSYTLNSPLNYIDPSGHKACQEQDENGNCVPETPVPLPSQGGGNGSNGSGRVGNNGGFGANGNAGRGRGRRIVIDDSFSDDEKALIQQVLSAYDLLFGGSDALEENLSLSTITEGWCNSSGTYNACYNDRDDSITLPYGWYSGAIVNSPDGTGFQIILGPPNVEAVARFPEGSLPTDEIAAKFVLAHEMGHAFAHGDPEAYGSFQANVDSPCTIFAGTNTNPLISRNAGRDIYAEVFADVMAAHLYSPGLLNQQMNYWVQTIMPGVLK